MFVYSRWLKNWLNFTCVPGVATGGPGELGSEGEHQIEESPDLDHDVGEADQFHHQLCVSYSWKSS